MATPNGVGGLLSSDQSSPNKKNRCLNASIQAVLTYTQRRHQSGDGRRFCNWKNKSHGQIRRRRL